LFYWIIEIPKSPKSPEEKKAKYIMLLFNWKLNNLFYWIIEIPKSPEENQRERYLSFDINIFKTSD